MSFKSIFEKYDVYKECPHCKNKSLVELEEGLFVCDNCGQEFNDYKEEVVEAVEEPSEEEKAALRADIKDYLEVGMGYSDYNQKVEDVAEAFNLPLDVAECYVWDILSSTESLEESSGKKKHEPTKMDIVNWLADHDQAWEDICDFFGSNDLEEVDYDNIIDWIFDHDLLSDDLMRHFGAEWFVGDLDELEGEEESLEEEYRVRPTGGKFAVFKTDGKGSADVIFTGTEEECYAKLNDIKNNGCEECLTESIEMLTKPIVTKKDYTWDFLDNMDEDDIKAFKNLGFIKDNKAIIPAGTRLKYAGNDGRFLLYNVIGTEYDLYFNDIDGVFEREFDEYFKIDEALKESESRPYLVKGFEAKRLPDERGWKNDPEKDFKVVFKKSYADEDEAMKVAKEVAERISDVYGLNFVEVYEDGELIDSITGPYNANISLQGFDESLSEDTIKQNGKWVNKGKEGTHGKFKTKKAADAQRKAMFANGYKEELKEELKDDMSPKAYSNYKKMIRDDGDFRSMVAFLRWNGINPFAHKEKFNDVFENPENYLGENGWPIDLWYNYLEGTPEGKEFFEREKNWLPDRIVNRSIYKEELKEARHGKSEYDDEGITKIDPVNFKKLVLQEVDDLKNDITFKTFSWGDNHVSYKGIFEACSIALGCFDFEIDKSSVKHANGIGNNNAYLIYYMEDDLKVYSGYLYITVDPYGGYYVGLKTLDGKSYCRMAIHGKWNRKEELKEGFSKEVDKSFSKKAYEIADDCWNKGKSRSKAKDFIAKTMKEIGYEVEEKDIPIIVNQVNKVYDEFGDDLVNEYKEEYERPGYEDMYLVCWDDVLGDYHEAKVKAKYPQDAIDKVRSRKNVYDIIDCTPINLFVSPKRIRKAELIEESSDLSNGYKEELKEARTRRPDPFNIEVLDSGYAANKEEFQQIKKEQIAKYKDKYPKVKCEIVRTDTPGLKMWWTITPKEGLKESVNDLEYDELEDPDSIAYYYYDNPDQLYDDVKDGSIDISHGAISDWALEEIINKADYTEEQIKFLWDCTGHWNESLKEANDRMLNPRDFYFSNERPEEKQKVELDAIELQGLDKEELKNILENAGNGSIIHNIYDTYWLQKDLKNGETPTESIVKKSTQVTQNYYAPVPTKYYEEVWKVSGSEQSIYDLIRIIKGKSKYYLVSSNPSLEEVNKHREFFGESLTEDFTEHEKDIIYQALATYDKEYADMDANERDDFDNVHDDIKELLKKISLMECIKEAYGDELPDDDDEPVWDTEFYKAEDGNYYRELYSKTVKDSDDFITDYTLYMKVLPGGGPDSVSFVTVFGDKDLYRPEDGDYDFECETPKEAFEWFENYDTEEEDEDDLELTTDDMNGGQWLESLNESYSTGYVKCRPYNTDLIYSVSVEGPFEGSGKKYNLVHLNLVAGKDYAEWDDRQVWVDANEFVDDIQSETFTWYPDDESLDDVLKDNGCEESGRPTVIWHYDENKDEWYRDRNIEKRADSFYTESLKEDYAEDHLKRLISAQHVISPKDKIQLFTTPKGNYEVKRNGKSMMILDKKNFRESEIEDLRLNGYFDDYDRMRMGESSDESLKEDINSKCFRIKLSGNVSYARRSFQEKNARTLCFGGLNKDGVFSILSPLSQGVTNSSEVSFLNERDAEEFAKKYIESSGKDADYYISPSRQSYNLVKVNTELGQAYATSKFIDYKKNSLKSKDLSKAIKESALNPNFDREKYGRFFDENNHLIPELADEYFDLVHQEQKAQHDFSNKENSLSERYPSDQVILPAPLRKKLNNLCYKYSGFKLPQEVAPLWDELYKLGIEVLIQGPPQDVAEDGAKSWMVPFQYNGETVDNSRFVYSVYEGSNSLKNDYNMYFS